MLRSVRYRLDKSGKDVRRFRKTTGIGRPGSCVARLRMPDYYSILGVSPDSPVEVIRKSYRRLARRYHPDVADMAPRQAGEIFKAISEAFSILKDTERRHQYDIDLRAFRAYEQQRYGHRPGRDVHAEVTITLREAILGCETAVEVDALSACVACLGSGSMPGGHGQRCEMCNGHGDFYKSTSDYENSRRTVLVVCPLCSGKGSKVFGVCEVCTGTGLKRRTKTIHVRVPAGIEEGTIMRVPGQGDASVEGGGHGDALLHIRTIPNDLLRREGFDLFSDLQVPLWMALLGGCIRVKTLHGRLRSVKVPAGTEDGSQLEVPHEGVLRRGRQFYRVRIIVPCVHESSKEEKEILYRLASLQNHLESA